jgi:hypothetical protein
MNNATARQATFRRTGVVRADSSILLKSVDLMIVEVTDLESALGQSRPRWSTPPAPGRPLCPESGSKIRVLASTAMALCGFEPRSLPLSGPGAAAQIRHEAARERSAVRPLGVDVLKWVVSQFEFCRFDGRSPATNSMLCLAQAASELAE